MPSRQRARKTYQKASQKVVVAARQRARDQQKQEEAKKKTRAARASARVARKRELDSLEPCQKEAINHVSTRAKVMHGRALADLESRIKGFGGYTKADTIECLRYIRDDAPIIIHMKEITLSLLTKDTHYRNQFETNMSGGTLDHSSRIRWERDMFGSCYDGVDGSLRVKYGCLNVSRDNFGVQRARRYGPIFMVLHPRVRHRTTFFYRDTGDFQSPLWTLATNDHYAHVLAHYADSDLKAALDVCKLANTGGLSSGHNIYREVQIHGSICLATDIQALSIPGCQNQASKKLLADVVAFGKKTNCEIRWQG